MDAHHSRAGAAAALTALLLGTSLAAADAAGSARTASTTTLVTSGSWGAVATTKTSAPYGTGPLVLGFTLLGTSTRYFNVVNTGALPLNAAMITATTRGNTAVIEACSTTWNETFGTCPSGTITTVTTTSTSPATLTASLPAYGSTIRLRARITDLLTVNSTVSVSVDVSRAQARAATRTGSQSGPERFAATGCSGCRERRTVSDR